MKRLSMNKEIVAKILYALAALGFIIYLVTNNSEFMFFGGLFLVAASLTLIVCKKSKK